MRLISAAASALLVSTAVAGPVAGFPSINGPSGAVQLGQHLRALNPLSKPTAQELETILSMKEMQIKGLEKDLACMVRCLKGLSRILAHGVEALVKALLETDKSTGSYPAQEYWDECLGDNEYMENAAGALPAGVTKQCKVNPTRVKIYTSLKNAIPALLPGKAGSHAQEKQGASGEQRNYNPIVAYPGSIGSSGRSKKLVPAALRYRTGTSKSSTSASSQWWGGCMVQCGTQGAGSFGANIVNALVRCLQPMKCGNPAAGLSHVNVPHLIKMAHSQVQGNFENAGVPVTAAAVIATLIVLLPAVAFA
ncbi:MAG: hypothetical protein M1826_005009 [Phylliscum demangeonii]|nr:MAG: hypothetical protein M1826_005009 [Phylliscum demangeonii]